MRDTPEHDLEGRDPNTPEPADRTQPVHPPEAMPDAEELAKIRRALSWRGRRPTLSRRGRGALALGAALVLGGGVAIGFQLFDEEPVVAYGQRWGKGSLSVSCGTAEEALPPDLDPWDAWLARHQSPGGRWDADEFWRRCVGENCAGGEHARGGADRDVGVTGAALLALISNGHGDRHAPLNDRVKRGLAWLRSRQGPDGVFRGESEPDVWSAADQAIATFALCRLYDSSREPEVATVARQALKGLAELARPERISAPFAGGEGDGAVTGAWAFLAFRAADRVGLERPSSALSLAQSWFLYPAQTSAGVALLLEEDGFSAAIGMPNPPKGQAPLAMAAGYLARGIRGERSCYADMRRSYNALRDARPEPSSTPAEYWLFAEEGLAMASGLDSSRLRFERRELFERQQAQSGCAAGSRQAPRPVYPGGRIYATALACLSLEIAYEAPGVEKPLIILEEEVEITRDVPKGPCQICEDGAMLPDSWDAAPATTKVFDLRYREDKVQGREAMSAGLAWLARAQNPDGSWGQGSERVGDTGFALVAFLRAGQTHRFGVFKRTVNKGLRWLKSRESLAGDSAEARGIAALAMCEAHAQSRDFKLRAPAARLLAALRSDEPPSLWSALARWVGDFSGLRGQGPCPGHERPPVFGLTGHDAELQANIALHDERIWLGNWMAERRLQGAIERLGLLELTGGAEAWSVFLGERPRPVVSTAKMLWLIQIPTAYQRPQ